MKNIFEYIDVGENFRLSEGAFGFSMMLDDSVCPGDGFSVEDDGSKLIFSNKKADVIIRYVRHKSDNAIECFCSVLNKSKDRVRLHDVNSLELYLLNGDKDVRIHSFFGGDIEHYYPPKNFSESEVIYCPAKQFPNPYWNIGYRISSLKGRSSDQDLSIAILENKERTGGLILGLLWSGDWFMDFSKHSDGNFHAFGGMQFLDILMEPGERLELPGFFIKAYRGNFEAGCNSLRRYFKNEYLSRFPAEQQMPPVSYDHWFGLGVNINEEILKNQADILDDLGIEYFVVDAGWFKARDNDMMDFSYGTGNWDGPDLNKFPNGLKPVFDYFKEKGYKPGLWFDPERAAPNSDTAVRYPDSMMKTDSAGDNHFKSDLMHVYFGDPEIVEYTKAYLKRYIEELDLRWIRWDYNINPRNYWKDHDRPGRRGESEIAHMKGLYEVLDWLNREYPQVVIEGCASGGQRMDLGTLRYSSVYWCNDQCYNCNTSRALLYNGNKIIPGNYLNRAVTPWLPKGEDVSDYEFMSLFGGSFAINDPVQDWTPVTRERCIKHLKVFKRIREYINDDYYQLLPVAKSLEDNEAWEFIDSEKQCGFVQVFRSEGNAEQFSVRFKGLTASKYMLTDPYTNESAEYSAQELLNGIDFKLDTFSSAVRIFEKTE